MNADDYQKLKQIFNSALDLSPEDRRAFVAEKCNGDGEMLRRVEKLLDSNDTGFLETPAAAPFSESLSKSRSGQRIGHYEVIRKIGSGGMGDVYLAIDGKLGRQVAIKILPDEFTADESRLDRFQLEARSASSLSHPNILTIFEVGEWQGTHYIATEYVEGETLRQRLSRERLSIAEAMDFGIQLAHGITAAHEASICHRDIKPENIMIRRDGLLKVVDFGLAKLVPSPFRTGSQSLGDEPTVKIVNTEPGVIMGTVQYMSPEQTRGLATDERSDIWSLGCVLYEMMTGHAPFRGDTSADMVAEIVKTHPELPSRLSGDVPERLDEIISKSLEKNPDERYQTAKDLLIDLKRLKRNLELEDVLERSNPRITSDSGEVVISGPNIISTRKGPKDLTEVNSAEYLYWGMKAHRWTAIGITLFIIGLVSGTALLVRYYWRERDPNEARQEYFSKIKLVAQALDASNLEYARQLLDETAPSKGETDFRNFEWRYLKLLLEERTASQPITLDHDGWVNSVTFSADGKSLATGSNNARIWEISTGRQTASFNGHSKPIVSVAISPDGSKLATGSFDKTAKLWDIASEQMQWSTTESPGDGLAIASLVFSTDGATVVGEDVDHKIKAWNVQTATETAPYQKFPKVGGRFAVSPDGKFFAAQTGAFFVSIFDNATGRKLTTLDAIGFVAKVVFSPDSKTLITAGSEKVAKLWALPTGKEIRSFANVTGGIAFSPDGKTIAICSKDTIKLWNVEKGYDTASLRGHKGDVVAIAFSLDGQKLASGGTDNTAKVWNVPLSEARGVMRAHKEAIRGISFSNDSKLIASASEDRTAKIWDVETEQERHTLRGHTDHVGSTAFSPDKRTLATGSQDGTVKVWEIATGKQLFGFNSVKPGMVSYSPNGEQIATAHFWDDQNVRLWNAGNGDLICSFPKKDAFKVQYSKDGRRVATSSGEKTVNIWDSGNCQPIWTSQQSESSEGYIAAFMPDGKLMALQVLNNGRSLRMFDTELNKELVTFTESKGGELSWADFSPDGHRLITSDKEGGLIKIWDIATGQELLSIDSGLENIENFAISPDGKVLAAFGGKDGTIRLFRSDTSS